jgi:GH15 family glucan-1,4-alpha-glucosidase
MPRGTIVLALLLAAPVSRAASPHPSYSTLSFSNGHGAATYDVAKARIVSLRDHLYARKNATETTVNLCYDTYFGARDGGKNVWLGETQVGSAGYLPGSGIAKVVQSHGALTIEQYFFSPFGLEAPALVMIAKVQASATLTDAALFSIHNFHLGGGPSGTSGEQIDYDAAKTSYRERGTTTSRLVLFRSLTPPSKHGASPLNPYGLVQAGGKLTDVQSSGVLDDAVSGFQWDLGLKAGESTWVGVAIAAGRTSEEASLTAALEAYLKGRTPQQLLDDELKAWDAWHASDLIPAGISNDERAVYQQALAILRMGQVREANAGGATPFGQIVASLPPGQWNISWVRDAAYAIAALARSGHPTEARDGLLFMLRGKAGVYVCCDQKGGPYVGVPYLISVTRYHGDGTEESDSNQDGPNVEFDNFGLFLWAAGETVARMGPSEASAFLSSEYAALRGVAELLIGLLEPSTGLLRADSSIWEHHWENGKRRHHTYSNLMAVVGLRAAAKLATQHGQTADAAKHGKAADALAAAIESKLVDPQTSILASDLESLGLGPNGYMDAAGVEAFLHEVLPRKGKLADATLAAYDAHLRTAAGPGYKRNDDGDTYDEREWLMIDLRIAALRALRGEPAQAKVLFDWVTAMARANHDLIPELLDQSTADYAGEIPMVGFGAGAYVLGLLDRASATPAPTDSAPAGDSPRRDGGAREAGPASDGPADRPSSDGGSSAPSEGCGCTAAGEPATGLALSWLLLGISRARRGRAAPDRRSRASAPRRSSRSSAPPRRPRARSR